MSVLGMIVRGWLLLIGVVLVFLKIIGDRNAKIDADNEQLYYDMLASHDPTDV